MKAFRVTGRFKMGARLVPFTKEYALKDRKLVEEKVLAELGSKHRAPRRSIKIEKVEELSAEQVTDTSVRMLLARK